MKKIWILLAVAGLLPRTVVFSQDKPGNFGIALSGYVKSDFFYDSRKTVNAREGHFLLWPAPVLPDANGIDLNDQQSLSMLAIQSRVSMKITGPDAFGAKTSGLIEGDFFGQSNANINLFRLRHAMVKFTWKNTELITGQYWNPLFVTGCFPSTIAFNTGVPLVSFSRDPQVRLTHTIGKVSFLVAALSQRDYPSRGPDPANNNITLVSPDFLKNSAVPDMHFRVSYSGENKENGTAFLAGAGVEWKKIVPRLYTSIGDTKQKVNESLSSFAVIAYSKIVVPSVTIKMQGRYGENITDVLSVSGFAVKTAAATDNGNQSYTPLSSATIWGELHSNGNNFRIGIFGGYLKNLGTKDAMSDPSNAVYGLGTDVDNLYRISPRMSYTWNKTKLGFEIEHTSAAFGSDYNENYIPSTTTRTANTRFLLSVIYKF